MTRLPDPNAHLVTLRVELDTARLFAADVNTLANVAHLVDQLDKHLSSGGLPPRQWTEAGHDPLAADALRRVEELVTEASGYARDDMRRRIPADAIRDAIDGPR
jgi:hypothetical protein